MYIKSLVCRFISRVARQERDNNLVLRELLLPTNRRFKTRALRISTSCDNRTDADEGFYTYSRCVICINILYTIRCTSIRIARASSLIRLTAASVRDFRDSTVTGSWSGAKRTEILSDHNFGLRLLHIGGDGRYIYIYTNTAGTRKASARYIFLGE